MVILHICYLNNNKANGISNVVPQHFINQKKINKNVGILNCNDIVIEKLIEENNKFNISDLQNFDVTSLKEPFNKPDLVIFHDVYIPIYTIIAKKLKKRSIPYIIVPHGSLSFHAQKIKPIKKKIANLLLFNKFIYNSVYIQFLSEEEKNMSKKFDKKSFVLGNGIEKTNYIKESFDSDTIKLIYVGRYAIYHKGIDILLEACLKCKDYMKKNNIKLDMFGANTRSGDGYKYIKNFINKYNLEDVIKLHGPIYDNDKIKQLLCHDLFIQISRHEGQPLGIMEAMEVGLPIIASEGTTFSNIIDKNKCGYKCSNIDEFYSVLKKVVYNKTKLNLMSENAKNYANENFLWEKVAKKTLDKYFLIINGGKL